MFTVSVLGVVEAYRDDVRLELPGGKTTEVLARLALDPGRPVRVEALLEELWGEPTGRNSLHRRSPNYAESLTQLARQASDSQLKGAHAAAPP